MAQLIEILRPISWSPNGWSGLVTNIDESRFTPDGSVISVDQSDLTCSIQFSDVQNIRDGIDEIFHVLFWMRIRTDIPTSLYMGIAKNNFVVVNRTIPLTTGGQVGDWYNLAPSSTWDQEFSGFSTAPINSIGLNLTVDGFPFFEVDLIEVLVYYNTPEPITKSPGLYEAALTGKTGKARKDDFISTPADALDLTLYDSEMLRRDTVYPDPIFTRLNMKPLVLQSINPVGRRSIILSGKSSILSRVEEPAVYTLSLEGKVPTVVHTKNQVVTPLCASAYIRGQQVGFEGHVLPTQLRMNLAGQAVIVDRSWTVTTAAGTAAIAGIQPTFDRGYIIPGGSVTLAGQPIEAVDSSRALPTGTAILTGQVPSFYPSLKLFLNGQPLVMNRAVSVPRASLTLLGEEPIIRSVKPPKGSIRLVGKQGPNLVFSTVLPPGDHGIMSLSSRYDIEHIATPTDEIDL